MVIGHFIGQSYEDAAHFVFLFDLLFILMCLWTYFRHLTDEGPTDQEFVSSLIGLPAALICRYADTTKQRVGVAMIFAALAAVSWLYTVYLDLVWMSGLRRRVEYGEVKINAFYWPFEWINVFILTAIAGNHAVLAVFCKRRIISAAVGTQPSGGGGIDGIL